MVENKPNKRMILKRIFLLIITILIFLFILETGLRLTYPFWANYNTEMWRYASELKQLSSNEGLGHEHVPNKTTYLYGVEIRTNSLGLRADKEYIVPKPKGINRILVLGDSITMGWGIEYGETYSKVLENLLNQDSKIKYEVINAGVGNYNAKNNLAMLKKLIYLEPDTIILGFYINDIEEITYPSKIVFWLKSHSYLYAFFSDKIINLKYKREDYNKYYLSLYKNERLKRNMEETLVEMINLANNNSIPFVFVNIPEFHQFDNYSFDFVNEFIENEIIKNSDVLYINLLPVFKNESPEDLWVSPSDPHPNVKAHKIIALNIYKSVN